MADYTKDIGGGIQVADFSGGLAQLQQRLGQNSQTDQLSQLLKLQQLQNAPLEQQKLEAEVQLKQNDILNLDLENEKKKIDLKKSQVEQSKEFFNALDDAFQNDFTQGRALLQQSLPNADAVENPDGTVSISYKKPSGDTVSFISDPKKISDPEKKIQIEAQNRKEWMNLGKDFKVQNQYFRNMQGLSKLGTAQGDIGIVFAFMKLQDPGSTVREGEQATAQNAPGVTERVRNLYNRSLTDEAPIFGPKGSTTRQRFIDAGRVLVENAKADLMMEGAGLKSVFERQRLDPNNILTPIGEFDVLTELKSGKKAKRQAVQPLDLNALDKASDADLDAEMKRLGIQ